MLENAFIALIDLIKALFLFIVPTIIFSSLGVLIKRTIQKKFSLDFLKSVLIASFLVFFFLLLFLYFTPWLRGLASENIGIRPEFAKATPFEAFRFFVLSILRILVVSIVLTLFVLPFIFIGALIMDSLKNKIKNYLINFGLANIIVLLLFLVVWLYFMPWLLIAFLYMIYFA